MMFKSWFEELLNTISIFLALWENHLSLIARSKTSLAIPKPEMNVAILYSPVAKTGKVLSRYFVAL